MTIQEYVTLAETIGKDAAAVLGTLGVLAAALAHVPAMPAKWAEFFARFASYAAARSFDVSKKSPPTDAAPVHITTPPVVLDEPPPPVAAIRGLTLLALLVFSACSPAATKQAETAALECYAAPAVQECLKGLVCSGPDKQCAIALAVYKTSCLELCGAPDAGTD